MTVCRHLLPEQAVGRYRYGESGARKMYWYDLWHLNSRKKFWRLQLHAGTTRTPVRQTWGVVVMHMQIVAVP